MAEHDVLPERRGQQQSSAMAVLGDVRHPGIAALVGSTSRRRPRSPNRMRPAVAGRSPSSVSISSPWPLPSTPAMPTTSPRWTTKLTSSMTGRSSSSRGEALDGQLGDVGDGRLAGLGGGQLAADHELGQVPGGDVGGVDGGDRATGADDRDAVGDLEHLVQLVGDEDDGLALGLELTEVDEEFLDLLGDEHGGRLVEDEDAGPAEEDLDDLDPLAFAHPECLDQLVGVDVEAVGIRRAP